MNEELNDRSRAVIDDLFATALTAPDPGPTRDVAAIVAAARKAHQVEEPPTRSRFRVWQGLAGVAAAAALTFGVVQVLPGAGEASNSADSASIQDLAEAPAAVRVAEAAPESGAPAMSSAAAESSAAAPPAAAEEPAVAGGSPDHEEAESCPAPSPEVLAAVQQANPDLTILEIPVTDTDCPEGTSFRVIGGTTSFDVVIDGPPLPAAVDLATPATLQVTPLPGAAAESVDLAVAAVVIAALEAALS